MLKWLKRSFCRHSELAFVRNIYGDEVCSWGFKRSLWRCARCGGVVARHELHDEAAQQSKGEAV